MSGWSSRARARTAPLQWAAGVTVTLTAEPDDYDEGEEPYIPDTSGLLRFLQSEVSWWYKPRRKEIANRPLIRSQAFGEAMDPYRLDKLARYEAHLDRKLERMLAMLLKLQDLRREVDAA